MTTKSKNINIRINGELKEKYEKALESAGVSVTDHITMKILDFILMIDTKLPEKEEIAPSAYIRVGNRRQITEEKTP